MRYLILMIACLVLGKAGASLAQQLPIKPARTIRFATREGTDMDVDLSPDGETLVFDLLGNLYTLPVSGGNATQITRGMALNKCPVWSPDGKQLAYVSDFSGAFHLNIRDVSGTFHKVIGLSDEQLTGEFSPLFPAWSLDGSYIAMNSHIYILNGGQIKLPSYVDWPISFSSDGNLLYYTHSFGPALYSYDLKNKLKLKVDTFAMDLSGLGLNTPTGAAISPDRHWLAYTVDHKSQRSLFIKDLLTKTDRLLVRSMIIDSLTDRQSLIPTPHFCFSPDSKNIFIGYAGKIHEISVATNDDHIIPFTADVKVDMGALNYHTFRVPFDIHPAKFIRWASKSPDGKQLLFVALNTIYIMDLPNGKPHILVKQPLAQYQPVWSPDGKWIAYVSWCDTVGGYVWRIPSKGGRPERLTKEAAQYRCPAWSPDGKQLAVVKGERMQLDDGHVELIILADKSKVDFKETIPLENQLSFSSDGKLINYEPKSKGVKSREGVLVSNTIDGAQPKVIAIGFPPYAFYSGITERSISPDGRFLVYSMGEELYLVPVAATDQSIYMYDAKIKNLAIRFSKGLDPHWENGGKTLAWCYGNHFYSIDPDKIVAIAHVKKKNEPELFPDSSILTVNVAPDQIVALPVMIKTAKSSAMIALKNARIITMHGSAVIEHGIILIANGRIAKVGTAHSMVIPKGTKVIDLAGKTIMPGLIDLHLHMHAPRNVIPQNPWMFLANLAFGITTARDPATSFNSFGYKELLESGQMLGPRLFPSGAAVNNGDGMNGILTNNLNDAGVTAIQRKELGGTFIKQYLLPTRIQREWLLLASEKHGLNMTNEGYFDPLGAVGQLKDGSTGIEHNFEGSDVYEDIITLFAKSGTYFTPTLQARPLGRPYFDRTYWHQPDTKLMHFISDNFSLKQILNASDSTADGFIYWAKIDAAIRNKGGRVTLGGHGDDEGIGTHDELWALQMGGLTNLQALQAGTIMAARAIGIQKDVGSIEPGKIADLVILNKNPLDDIHNSREIKYVMKSGILYDGDTLDELWPVYKKCPEWRMKDAAVTSKN